VALDAPAERKHDMTDGYRFVGGESDASSDIVVLGMVL
jgi:hypothetical protein